MMDFVLEAWVSGIIEGKKIQWMIGKREPWQPGEKLKLLFAGYNGTRNTGSDVRVEEMLRQIRRILGPENVDLSMMTFNFDGRARCLADTQRAGTVAYEPLLWAIRFVRLCPRHQNILEEICPHCHGSSFPLAANSRPGFCLRCKHWLGSAACDKTDAQAASLRQCELEYEIWLGEQMGDMLALAPQLEGLPLGSRLRNNLVSYVDQLAAGNFEEFCRITKTPRIFLRGVMIEKHRSRADLLLRLCYSLRIPVRKLLQKGSAPPIATAVPQKRRLGKNQRRRPDILRALQQALVEEPPPMLAEVARRLLHHKRTESLTRIAPKLCRRIVVRHQKAVLRLPRKGKPRICRKNEIRKCLKASLSQLEPISVQRVAVKLGYCNAGCLRREFPDLCRAIGKKLQRLKGNRQRWRAREFVRILKESPLQSATRVCQRLGYRMPSTLLFNFPSEYLALHA